MPPVRDFVAKHAPNPYQNETTRGWTQESSVQPIRQRLSTADSFFFHMRANDLETRIKRSNEQLFQKTEFADKEYENPEEEHRQFRTCRENANGILT